MKKRRHEKILELIAKHSIDTQEELIGLLRREGFEVTQATISRDINELGLIKKPDGGRYRYFAPAEPLETEKYESIFRSAVISVDYASNIVVIKCHSGMANAAAAALDATDLPGVVGTLAGDDTIMVVARSEQDAVRLTQQFQKIKLS